jgi:hypothetical protein
MMRIVALSILIGSSFGLPAVAGEDDAAALRDHCRAEIAATGSTCDCLLRQFSKLSDAQQAVVAATIRDDADAAAAARATLTNADAAEADSFLQRETLLCRPSG